MHNIKNNLPERRDWAQTPPGSLLLVDSWEHLVGTIEGKKVTSQTNLIIVKMSPLIRLFSDIPFM